MTTGVHLKEPARLSLARLAFDACALAVVSAPLPIALAALSGVGHRWVDILAQFTAPALAAALVAALGFVALRRWKWGVAAAVVTAVLLVAVWPQWFPPMGRPQAGAPILRLYSANLHYRNDDVATIRRSIQAADADVVVLIELGGQLGPRADEILQGYPHRVASIRLDQARGPSRSVIASRYPLTPLRDPPDGLHSVAAIARTPLGPVNIVGVHLTRPWPYQFQWGQITQTMALADIRRGLFGPVIVAGDFNSVSSARIGRQVREDMALVPAPGFPGTWPDALPSAFGITIDQVYRSPDLALISRRLGRPAGSDHRPVVTEFTRAAD